MATWGYVFLATVLLVIGFLGYCLVAVGTRKTSEEQEKDDTYQMQYIQEKIGRSHNRKHT